MSERDFVRLSRELDTLFELTDQARAERLAALRVDDPAFADELERILAADADSGVLDAGIANAAPTFMSRLAAAHDAAPAAATEAGRRIDHYRLVERIGSGGMGEVWRAERVDDFQQQVAVKLIRPLLDSPSLRERFTRERQILARLDHPNIARLLDGGVAEDGTPWFAMEFVRGDTITAFADAQRLGTRARVELLLQVCDAVAHAQSQLVIHRDLKPSNVLVGSDARARVLDFGIARLIDDTPDVRLTGTGVRVFSPAYAAPEQIRGDAAGTATDVYALGAVLFELLTGGPPHPQRSAAPERLLSQISDETAPRASDALRGRSDSRGTRSTATSRELAGDLDTIVAKALQPEPARRYAGAAQLADDLRRWLDGHPIAARPDTAGYRMRKFVTRHRIAVGSASSVLLALIAGFGMAVWQAGIARQQAARADEQARLAVSEAARAEREAAQARALTGRVRHVKEFFVSGFFAVDPMRRASDGPVTIDDAFDALLERARTELASDPVLQADVFDDFGEIRANQGRFDDAEALFRQALAVAEREFGPQHPAVAETLLNLGVVASYRGLAQEAQAFVARAVDILEKDDGGDPLALPAALGSQASLLGGAGETARALPIAQRALDILRREAPDSAHLLATLTNLGTMYSNAGDLDRSDALLLEAAQRIEAKQGPEAATLWPVFTTLAATAFIRGDVEQEAAYTERAVRIARENFPGAHPWRAGSLVDRGLQISRSGDWERGEAMMAEGIALFDTLKSPEVIAALRQLAISQRARDDDAGALGSLERAYATCVARGNEAHPLCATIRANRALVYARVGRATEALAEADAALATLAGDASRYSEQGQAMEARAAAFKALGRIDEARAELDRVVSMLAANFGPDHPETRRVTAGRATLD